MATGCENCKKALTSRQDRFCSKPCQYKGRWANRNKKQEYKNFIKRFWSLVTKTRTCWLWQGQKTKKGYGKVGYGKVELYVHHVSWKLSHGKIPHGMWILHKCDVRNCVRPSHLFFGTAKDNSVDMVSKGRSTRGVRHPFARLSESAVSEIKRTFKWGNGRLLAKKFRVSRSAITSVVHGRSWRHVK